jgi:hypothetical protein
VKSRPWANVKDRDLIAMSHTEAEDLDIAWEEAHELKGCDVVANTHRGCTTRDRTKPGVATRWFDLVAACRERGCTTDGTTWQHAATCLFARRGRITSADEAKEAVAMTVKRATDDPDIPPKHLTVLRAIAAAGLGHTTPSIDVLASRAYLREQTGLTDGEVQAALAWLKRHRYIAHVAEDEISMRFVRRAAERARQFGHTTNVYRLLPTPDAFEVTPDYDQLDTLLAAM